MADASASNTDCDAFFSLFFLVLSQVLFISHREFYDFDDDMS